MWLTTLDASGPDSYIHAARLADPLTACGVPVVWQARERWPTGREAPVCGACGLALFVLERSSAGER